MSNVTYILGAGASCKSQPLVSNMKERMNLLLEILDYKSVCSKLIPFKLQDNKNKLYEKYIDVVRESFKHYTPDTYAKKLWLKGDKKLDTFKEFLNLYFIFEQQFHLSGLTLKYLIEKDKYNNKPNSELIYEKACRTGDFTDDVFNFVVINQNTLTDNYKSNIANFYNNIKTTIDYRYDVFYSTLLQVLEEENSDPQLILPKEINIISWNYDNQFEFAYKPYTNGMSYEDIRKSLNINPTKYDQNKSHIIKLNGECNIKDLDGGNDGFLTFSKALEMLLEGKSPENLIKFAWEKETSTEKINIVNKIMENTDELIIIGYSFPNFNREVDFKNIKKFSTLNVENQKNNKIVIQVPDKKEFEKINDRVTALINPKILGNVNFPITHIEDTDQFYIPMI